MMRRILAVAALLLAGCISAAPPAAHTGALDLAAASAALAPSHDHLGVAGHDLRQGLEAVGFLDVRDMLGDEAGRPSDIQFFGDKAAVTVNGGAGGFVLLDVKDPAHIKVLSRYRSGSEDNWYTKFSSDGARVYLTANGNFRQNDAVAGLLADGQTRTATDAVRGLQAIDVRDPAAPKLVGAFPAPIRVINLAVHRYQDSEYVFATVVDDRNILGAPTATGVMPNHVSVLRVDELANGAVRFEEVARWAPPGSGQNVLVHDVSLAEHPVTHRLMLAAACWDAGAWFLDVTDPAAPAPLGHVAQIDPADHVHTVKLHPGLVDGKQYAVASPETFAGEPSGPYLLIDITDPAAPRLVDRWSLPGNLTNPESLLWSPHEFSLANGTIFTSNYHAGVWVLAIREGRLVPTAAWQTPADGRPGWAPRAGGHWSIDSETAIMHEGFVYDVDMDAGLVVLRER